MHKTLRALSITKASLLIRRACSVRESIPFGAAFKEKNGTQLAKFVAEQKLCFTCLNGNHGFRNCTKAKTCPEQDCESTHVLLHGADRIFQQRMSLNRRMLNMFPLMLQWGWKITKNYRKDLLVTTVGVSSDSTCVQTLVLSDGASTHSWVSASESNSVSRLNRITPICLSLWMLI